MTMCNPYYITCKVILKQAAAWFFITVSFSKRYARSADQPTPVPLVDHPRHILDLTIHHIKGCRYINKQFSIDSFLDCAKVITRFLISTLTLSSDHSIRLAIKNIQVLNLSLILHGSYLKPKAQGIF